MVSSFSLIAVDLDLNLIRIFNPDNFRIKSKIRINLNISKVYEANFIFLFNNPDPNFFYFFVNMGPGETPSY